MCIWDTGDAQSGCGILHKVDLGYLLHRVVYERESESERDNCWELLHTVRGSAFLDAILVVSGA